MGIETSEMWWKSAVLLAVIGLPLSYAVIVVYGFVKILVGEGLEAKRWCRKCGLKKRKFRCGDGVLDYIYVGADEENGGILWVKPLDGESKARVAVRRKVGGKGSRKWEYEVYKPEIVEDAEARGMLVWSVVWEVGKVVLADIGKRVVLMELEEILKRLKERWGVKSGVSEERVKEIVEEMKGEVVVEKGVNGFEEEENEARRRRIEEGGEAIETIVRYAKERGYRRVSEFGAGDYANMRLEILEVERKKEERKGKVNEGV